MRLRSFDFEDQQIAAFGSSYTESVLARGSDQQVKLFKQHLKLPILATQVALGEDHFSHFLNPRGIRQWQILLKDVFHLRQEDPLQPLLEIQRIDRKRFNAG
ncbi:hypothetical protein D3C78_1659580 [compost metagenome]